MPRRMRSQYPIERLLIQPRPTAMHHRLIKRLRFSQAFGVMRHAVFELLVQPAVAFLPGPGCCCLRVAAKYSRSRGWASRRPVSASCSSRRRSCRRLRWHFQRWEAFEVDQRFGQAGDGSGSLMQRGQVFQGGRAVEETQQAQRRQQLGSLAPHRQTSAHRRQSPEKHGHPWFLHPPRPNLSGHVDGCRR